MNKIKRFFGGVITACLIVSCTSEDDIAPSYEDGNWEKIGCSLGVDKGTITQTRTMGELDEKDLPRGEYPSKLGVYIHKYDEGTVSGTVALRGETSDEGQEPNTDFLYKVSKDGTKVQIVSPSNTNNMLELAILDDISNWQTAELFFFTSQEEIENIELPKIKEEDWYGYPDPRDECGDILFSSEGYFFCWKDSKTLGLYYIVKNSNKPVDKGEVKEVTEYSTKSMEVVMKRMTTCVSLRIIIIDHTEVDGNNIVYVPIEGVENGTDEQAPLNLTNNVLHSYIQNHYAYLLDSKNKDEHIIDVRDIFVRKKVFEGYPYKYSWGDGVDFMDRTTVYLCNLNFPAWVDALTYYEHASTDMYGVTATCDNEPFLPAFSEKVPIDKLSLFMGIGKRDITDKEQGGTYNKIIRYNITDVVWHLTANTHTYVYVPITLDEIVQLYIKMQKPGTNSKTRSVQDIEEVTLPSDRIITFSKPFYSEYE